MAEPIVVTTPDGQEFEFPAGTSQDVMKSAMQKHFGKSQSQGMPDKILGIDLPSQQQIGQMYSKTVDRENVQNAESERILTERGNKLIEARQRDPDYIGWTPTKPPAAYGASRYASADSATFGFGDDVVKLFDRDRGMRIDRATKYGREKYPDAAFKGDAMGGSVSALATAPVSLPRTLQLARFLPRGTQGVSAGAASGAIWDTIYQLGQGEGTASERVRDIDTDRTKLAAATGGVLGGAFSAFTRTLSDGQNEFATVLEEIVDDSGAISDDGVRGLERFLKSNGIALDNVTLGRLNVAFQNAAQAGSKSLSLPVRVKDILVDAFDDGTNQLRDAVETQLRGTAVQKGPGATTVLGAVDEDVAASRAAIDENYGKVLGKKARIKSEDQTKEQLAEIGREGYGPLLRAGPQSDQGEQALLSVLNGPGINKLKSPLEEIAAGEGLSLEQMIEAEPLRAAHWMQSKARALAESATDPVRSSAFGALRRRLLSAINEAAPEYDKLRKKYGDEFGNLQALEFGDKFLTQARDAFSIDKMKRAFSDLTPRQKNIALLSVRDALRSATGRGQRDKAPRLSRVGDEQVLDAMEYVFGKRGARVAKGIEEVQEFLGSRQRIDPRRGSPTASNQEAVKAATENLQSPLRRRVGGAMQNLAGDAAFTAAGFAPINSFRKAIGRAGQSVSGDVSGRMNAFAQLLEAKVSPASGATQNAFKRARGPDGRFISREAASKEKSEVAQRATDAAAVGLLGVGAAGTADAQETDYSAQLQKANTRVEELQTELSSIEAEFARIAGADTPAEEKQILLKEMGLYAGPIDGDIGKGSRAAIDQAKAMISARAEQKREDLQAARASLDDIKLSQVYDETQSDPYGPWIQKGAQAAGFLGGLYLGKRFRGGAVKKSQLEADKITKRANAFITTDADGVVKPITKARSGPNSLPQRAGNMNQLYREGGAEDAYPFKSKVKGGEWTTRSNAADVNSLYPAPQKFNAKDQVFTAAGAIDAAVFENMRHEEQKKLDDARDRIRKFQGNPDKIADYKKALEEENRSEAFVNLYTTLSRLGAGAAVGRVMGARSQPYARPKPELGKAETEVGMLREEMARRRRN